MLMQSLRAVGYTTAAALADLVDNSIAAGARRICINLTVKGRPFLAIVDDGSGMDAAELETAMRFGSRDPRDRRKGIDLGRFGLGMKTASISQCRRLTVISAKSGRISATRWDLDECDRRRAWWLQRPPHASLPSGPVDLLAAQGQGTAVIWEELDRIATSVGSDDGRPIEEAVLGAIDHLQLVFHRFLSGELVGPFSILLNERPISPLDPFLAGHKLGQALHPETFLVKGLPVTVSPFVLPFPSRLRESELERAGGRESLKTGHGFYIYRGGRLVVPEAGSGSCLPTSWCGSPESKSMSQWSLTISGRWTSERPSWSRRPSCDRS